MAKITKNELEALSLKLMHKSLAIDKICKLSGIIVRSFCWLAVIYMIVECIRDVGGVEVAKVFRSIADCIVSMSVDRIVLIVIVIVQAFTIFVKSRSRERHIDKISSQRDIIESKDVYRSSSGLTGAGIPPKEKK